MWSISSVSAVVPYVVGLREVAGDPLADRLRLAHVDHAAAGVAEEVDAGLVGQGEALLAEPLPALLFGWCVDGHGLLPRSCRTRAGPQLGCRSAVPGTMYRMRTTILLAALAALVLCAPASANYRVGHLRAGRPDLRSTALAGAQAQARPLHRAVGLLPGRRARRGDDVHERRARAQAGRARDVHGPPRVLRRTASTRGPRSAGRRRRPRTPAPSRSSRRPSRGSRPTRPGTRPTTSPSRRPRARSAPRTTTPPCAPTARAARSSAPTCSTRARSRPGCGASSATPRTRRRIWGLHNYKDVNRKQSKGLTNVLKTVPGEVWLTETGGITKFESAGFKTLALARRVGDAVHVPARRPLRLAQEGLQVQADAALRLPLVR